MVESIGVDLNFTENLFHVLGLKVGSYLKSKPWKVTLPVVL